jgi:hypothetical protein
VVGRGPLPFQRNTCSVRIQCTACSDVQEAVDFCYSGTACAGPTQQCTAGSSECCFTVITAAAALHLCVAQAAGRSPQGRSLLLRCVPVFRLTGVLQQSSDEHVAVKLLALSAALLPGEAKAVYVRQSVMVCCVHTSYVPAAMC